MVGPAMAQGNPKHLAPVLQIRCPLERREHTAAARRPFSSKGRLAPGWKSILCSARGCLPVLAPRRNIGPQRAMRQWSCNPSLLARNARNCFACRRAPARMTLLPSFSPWRQVAGTAFGAVVGPSLIRPCALLNAAPGVRNRESESALCLTSMLPVRTLHGPRDQTGGAD